MRYASIVLFLICAFIAGCSSYQPTKNVWKGTKSLWYTYASPPASLDYDDKGDLSEGSLRLAKSMFAIDGELTRLERIMLNADKPPSQEWISNFAIDVPWINGIAGVKYDGTVLGHEPPVSAKQLDYIPLLYEDSKQKRTALRGDVQITDLGPEVLLAAPLYESSNFLGIVCVHFDMRTLAKNFAAAEKLVILSPYGLLWPGQYDYAATPLAGQNWEKVCKESSSGSCSNGHGKFFYQVRYLGNLPIVFASPENDSFPKGNGSVEQGLAFFPKDRPKLPPPPHVERKDKQEKGIPVFGQKEELEPDLLPPDKQEAQPPLMEANPQPSKKPERRRVRVRERIPHEVIMPTRPEPVTVKPDLDLGPDIKTPTLPGGRPSPFGSTQQSTEKPATTEKPVGEPSSSEPKKSEKVDSPKESDSETKPKLLPGGRPNPFGS